MIRQIHLDPRVEKQLETMTRGDRRQLRAAEQAAAIIAQARKGQLPAEAGCAFTRNGEARIAGCRKIDLGGGYRLVTVKQDEALYLLFVGTHDECDRWIDNHRVNLPLELIALRCRTLGHVLPETRPAPAAPDREVEEEDWIGPISDKDLRQIFCGLLKSR